MLPESNKRWKTGPEKRALKREMETGRSCLFVCMYVCFFQDISTSRPLSEYKVVSCYSPVNSTLHSDDSVGVSFVTSARHVKIEKKIADS